MHPACSLVTKVNCAALLFLDNVHTVCAECTWFDMSLYNIILSSMVTAVVQRFYNNAQS